MDIRSLGKDFAIQQTSGRTLLARSRRIYGMGREAYSMGIQARQRSYVSWKTERNHVRTFRDDFPLCEKREGIIEISSMDERGSWSRSLDYHGRTSETVRHVIVDVDEQNVYERHPGSFGDSPHFFNGVMGNERQIRFSGICGKGICRPAEHPIIAEGFVFKIIYELPNRSGKYESFEDSVGIIVTFLQIKYPNPFALDGRGFAAQHRTLPYGAKIRIQPRECENRRVRDH